MGGERVAYLVLANLLAATQHRGDLVKESKMRVVATVSLSDKETLHQIVSPILGEIGKTFSIDFGAFGKV